MPTSKQNENVPRGYLTRKMLKDQAGITEYDLRKLEESGVVKPIKKHDNGWCLYAESVLDKIKYRNIGHRKNTAIVYTNDEGIKVFKLLKQNKPLDEIIIESGVHPLAVNQILKDYCSITKQLIISTEILEKINNLPIDGELPIKYDYQLLEILSEITKEPKCTKCGIRPKGLCTGCAKHSIMKMIAKQAMREAQKAERDLQNEKSPIEHKPEADDESGEKLASNQ